MIINFLSFTVAFSFVFLMQDSPGLCCVPCHVLVDNILCILPTTDILALSTTCRYFWSLIGSNGTLWPSLLPYVHKRQNIKHFGGSTRDSFTDSSSDISGVYYSWEQQCTGVGCKNSILILAQEGEDLWSGRFLICSRTYYIHHWCVHLFGHIQLWFFFLETSCTVESSEASATSRGA